MAEFDYKEYSKQMRENAVKDSNGNIICSADLWEHIASIIERTETEREGRTKKCFNFCLKNWQNIILTIVFFSLFISFIVPFVYGLSTLLWEWAMNPNVP